MVMIKKSYTHSIAATQKGTSLGAFYILEPNDLQIESPKWYLTYIHEYDEIVR